MNRPAGKRAIRLVTFDLDDTLWGIDGVIPRAEAKMWAWLRARAPDVRPPAAAEAAAVREAVVQAQPGIEHDISRLREVMVQTLLERAGHPPHEAATLAAGAFAEFLNWRHQVEFFPNALAVLEQLTPHYTLAALTNGNADYRRLRLDRYFAFGYCAADVGASKPDPAMFVRALTRAGVTPTEAAHVGDHPVNDIQAANAVGMATIKVRIAPPPPSRRPASPQDTGAHGEPDATVARLQDLPAALAALAAHATTLTPAERVRQHSAAAPNGPPTPRSRQNTAR